MVGVTDRCSRTGWDDVLHLLCVTARVINEIGEDGLTVSVFDDGGAGGGYARILGAPAKTYSRHEG